MVALEMENMPEELAVLEVVYPMVQQVVLEQQIKVLMGQQLAAAYMEQVVVVHLLQVQLHQETVVMV